jgi:dihydrofolate reductase
VAKLIYSGIMSLDGYTVDASGSFDWSFPDEEVHAAVNDVERTVGTYLFGRRMYEVLSAWETMPLDDEPDVMVDYASIWHAADKIVFSRTLDAPTTPQTRIERDFDPDAIRALKQSAARDLSIGGTQLASRAVRAGLIDEYHLFISPVIVGGGQRYLPDDVRIDLELLDERRFTNGVTHLHYRTRG